MNLDRRTGFIKGYALVEYETFEDAKRAIENLEGASVLGQKIHANWAFVKGCLVCWNAQSGYSNDSHQQTPQ